MQKLISFLREHKAFTWAVGILLVLEIALRILPMEYSMGAGVFLTNYRRSIAESEQKIADYVIIGDSRSLSLHGRTAEPDSDYSVYNFSLPAMSPRYFPYLLRKIMSHRKPEDRPAAVVFAGDPGLFQASWIYPYHDKAGRYSDGVHDSLGKYLWNRFWLRLQSLVSPDTEKRRAPNNSLLWETFSHRFLHLFSMGELAEMFTGAERIFILREALPLQYKTYKWRDGLRQHTFGVRGDYFLPFDFPENCDSCAALLTDRCHPEVPRIADNRRMKEYLERQGGGFNLANRLNPQKRFNYLLARDNHVARQAARFNEMSPDFTAIEDLIAEARRWDVKLVFTDVPSMEAYRGTRYHREFFEGLARYAEQEAGVYLLRFPEPYYPKELFVEQVHYECKGAERLNREFYDEVIPAVVKLAPPRR